MKNKMLGSKGCWTVWLCAIFSVCTLSAQSLDSTRSLARGAMARGDYAAAEPLWLRVQYFAGDNPDFETLLSLAEIDYQLGWFSSALDAFDYAGRLTPSDSLLAHCTLRAAAAGLQTRQYSDARHRLEALGPVADSATEVRRQFFLGSAAYGQGDFIMAEAYWAGCTSGESERAQLHKLFERHAQAGPKHAGVPIIMSLLVPGSGQLSLGHPGKALNSIVLLGVLAAGGIYVGAVVGVVDALVLVLPTFSRYYIGGAIRAGRDARSKLQEERDDVLRQILELVGD